MEREELAQALADLSSAQSVEIDGDNLGILFPPGEAGIIGDENMDGRQ
jgi:hypothetical protein